jgi:hypothetical protein
MVLQALASILAVLHEKWTEPLCIEFMDVAIRSLSDTQNTSVAMRFLSDMEIHSLLGRVPSTENRQNIVDYTCYTAQFLKFDPIVPPKSNRKEPWEYDKELCKLRNQIERLLRLIQGFRRVFCRFEKLDVMYIAFIQFALVFVSIR